MTYPEFIRHVLQAALENFTRTHDELDVVDCWEPRVQDVKERLFVRRQRVAREQLDEVPEVVSTAVRISLVSAPIPLAPPHRAHTWQSRPGRWGAPRALGLQQRDNRTRNDTARRDSLPRGIHP